MHAAEILLVDLASPDEVEVTASRMHAQAMSTLDPVTRGARMLRNSRGCPGPVKRLRLKDAVAASRGIADQAHVRLRNFRNVLCVTTLLIVILMSLFVFLVSRNPLMVPFCFTPSAGRHVCPSGSPPRPRVILLVTGPRLLGARWQPRSRSAISAVLPRRPTSRIALAALKVPTVWLQAVVSYLLLRGQFVPGLSALDSQEQILAYALVLGYAQQIFTRLVDRQAQSILANVPSKETRAVQPATAHGTRATPGV